MRNLFISLALSGLVVTTCAYAQTPPCNAGEHTTLGENIIPVQNGNITYCVSDFGWSDTWLLGVPTRYNKLNDVLSGDDAFNLKYDIPPGGLGPGSGWLTPSLDRGTLSAQDAPGWTVRTLWTVVTPVHYVGAATNLAESVIQNTDGLRITIDTYAPPGTFGVQISLTIANTSAGVINNLRLADYFNFHPNGSDNNQNFLGTTRFTGNCINTTGQPLVILDGTACGIFAPTQFEVGYAYQKGPVAPVWQDVGNEIYNGVSGPVGPDDTAGAMQWKLGNLAPGASVRFAVGKNVTPFAPPVLAKAFVPAFIAVNGTSALTFTVTNPNTQTLTGVNFSDTLPPSVLVANLSIITGTCGGGTISAPADGSVIQLSGTTLAGGASCTFSVNVIGHAGGTYVNTTSPVGSTEGGQGNPASATLVVSPPPRITKKFTPASIFVNANSTLAFTIVNPATITLTGIGFTDAFPSGLVDAATPAVTNTCSGTLAGFTAGSANVSLAGASLPASGSCTITVSVVGNTPGSKLNTTSVVTSIEAGNGNSASDTLTVVAPPSISKLFNPASITDGNTSVLTFSLSNPIANPVPLTGVGFTDPLPAGVVVAPTPGVVNNCGGTLAGFTAGSTTFSLSGVTIAPGGACTIAVSVVGNGVGQKNNVTSAVTSIEGGNGNTASATLTVTPVLAPHISKLFSPASIAVGANSTLTFTITNPATINLSGIGFSDAFPAGVAVGQPPAVTNTCGGTLTGFTSGSTTVSLAGASLAVGGSCTISVGVVGITPGSKVNVTSPVTSLEGGNGNTATDTLTVTGPPAIGKGFNPLSVAVGGTSILTFTLANPNASVALLGVAFSDSFPAGVTVAAAPGTANSCGGTLNGFTAGSTNVGLTGGTIAAGGTCLISVSVIGSTVGTKNNATNAVTSSNGGTGNIATGTLIVTPPILPPSIGKVFNPASVQLGGLSVLTFNLANPNTDPNPATLTGVGFTDNFPPGVTVAPAPGATNTCGGVLNGFTSGSTAISLTGGTLPAGGACTISVSVVGGSTGTKTNVTSVVTSTEGGNGNTATAQLVVGVIPPVLTKFFGNPSITLNTATTLTFTLSNPNSDRSLTQVTFTDPLPGALKLANPTALNGTCDLNTITAVAGSATITVANAVLLPLGSCTFTVNVTGLTPGQLINITSTVLSAEAPPGNPATAPILIGNGYLLTYLANLDRGDSFVDITNTGASGADLRSGTTASATGAVCANVYVFSPDEQMVSCCSCPVTPNGLVSLSANLDLLSNTVTPTNPTSVVVKLLASTPVGNSCTNSASSVTPALLANGAAAFSTTLHLTPSAGGSFAPTEKPFNAATLSAGELARLTGLCNFIIANGSGFGVCRSCRLGGLGSDRQ